MIAAPGGSALDDRSPSSSSSSRCADTACYTRSSRYAERHLDSPVEETDGKEVRKKRIDGRKGKFVELNGDDVSASSDHDVKHANPADGGTGGSGEHDNNLRKMEPSKDINMNDADDLQEIDLQDGALLPLDCILREAAFGISDAFQLEPDDSDDLNVDIVKAAYVPKRPSSNVRVLFQLLAFNVFLCIIQATCGIIANSLALLGDGMLMGVDVITYVVNIYVERKKTMSSRHKAKVDQWGAILSLVLLSFTTVWILVDSVGRLLYPEDVTVDGRIMFIFTLFNLLIDAILVRNFIKSGADSSSMNMKSAMLHLGADIVRGFGVLVSSCWIWTHPGDGMVADSICSLFVSVFILFSTVKIGGSLFYKICFDPTELVDEGTLKEVIGVYDETPIQSV